MEFVIQLLKEKKIEIQKDYQGIEDNIDIVKCHAAKLISDQIDNAIKTLEYEYYWKHLNERQVCEKLGVWKSR